MTAGRLVLCRPQGGLNDILCQVEWVCRYAERYGRTVVIDTDYAHAGSFRDRFSDYFVSRQRNLILNADPIAATLDQLAVFPPHLAGRMTRYETRYDFERFKFVEAESGAPMSFDYMRDYDEPLLVHHDSGGGVVSVDALARLRLHDNIVERLIQRLQRIPPGYTSLHIRHTDYRSRYEQVLASMSKEITGPVFVATDNAACLDVCRATFGEANVYTFASLPTADGQPLHRRPDREGAPRINSDAILDLLMLALSGRCYGFELEQNPYGVKYSGFSVLALNLKKAKPVLRALIGRDDARLDPFLGPPEAQS
jgi:hypothetical protein